MGRGAFTPSYYAVLRWGRANYKQIANGLGRMTLYRYFLSIGRKPQKSALGAVS